MHVPNLHVANKFSTEQLEITFKHPNFVLEPF